MLGAIGPQAHSTAAAAHSPTAAAGFGFGFDLGRDCGLRLKKTNSGSPGDDLEKQSFRILKGIADPHFQGLGLKLKSSAIFLKYVHVCMSTIHEGGLMTRFNIVKNM